MGLKHIVATSPAGTLIPTLCIIEGLPAAMYTLPLFLCSYYGRRSGGIGMCEQHPKGPAAKWAQQERWGERPNRAFCPGTYLYMRVFCCISS